MSTTDVFAKASREHLRFSIEYTHHGQPRSVGYALEDMWDLPLNYNGREPGLIQVGIDIIKLTKEDDTDVSELLGKDTTTPVVESKEMRDNKLRLEVIKYIIKVKTEEAEAAENAVISDQKKERAKTLLAARDEGKMDDLSDTDLQRVVEGKEPLYAPTEPVEPADGE